MALLDRVMADLPRFLLAGTRVAGVLFLLPIFGRGTLPPLHRLWITLLLALLLFPMAGGGGATGGTGIALVPLAAAELAVGLLIGFVSLLFLEAAKYAGQISGVHIGFGLANVVDPVTQEQNTLVDQLQGLMALVLFVILGGHRMVLLALATSFQLVPLGHPTLSAGLTEGLVRAFSAFVVLGIQIAAPVLASVFLTEALVGILSRGVPQLNIFSVGLALRIVVGMVVLGATLPLFVHLMSQAIGTMPAELDGLVHELGR